MLTLAITKSGSALKIFSRLGSATFPVFITPSGRSRLRDAQESSHAPTTSPPARSHTSVKEPMRVTTLWGLSTVTSLPRASGNVTAVGETSVSDVYKRQGRNHRQGLRISAWY